MKLSKEQKRLLDFNNSTILKAGPGSGKTLSISKLVKKYIENWREQYKGIAILSFSNSGISELREKIDMNIDYPHYIGTIDGFIERYIFYPYSRLFYFKNDIRPKVINDDNSDFFKILRQNAKYTSECYKNKCYYETIKIDENNEIEIPKDSCQTKRKLPCKTYKELGIKYSYATHYDATSISVQILKKYNQVAKALVKRFPVIIIDEAQDTSYIQMKLIEELEKNGHDKIYIVGDSDQAVYEWREASPEVFTNKYQDKRYNQIEFIENHRSSQKICNATYPFSTLSKTAIAVGESKDYKEFPILLFYNNINEACEFFEDICEKNEIKKR